jgi:hypothetical protein
MNARRRRPQCKEGVHVEPCLHDAHGSVHQAEYVSDLVGHCQPQQMSDLESGEPRRRSRYRLRSNGANQIFVAGHEDHDDVAVHRSGLLGEARRSIEEALEIRDRLCEGFYLAELYRLRGELHLASHDDAGSGHLADADFERALQIADSQDARQLFLRAGPVAHKGFEGCSWAASALLRRWR